MRFSFPTRCLVAAIVLAPVFWAFAVQNDDPTKDDPKKGPPTEDATGAFSICPLSPLYFHGGYMTYYAKQCGSDECYRTWDDVPFKPLADATVLCGSTTNCLSFPGIGLPFGKAKGLFKNPNPTMKGKGYGKTKDDKEDYKVNPDLPAAGEIKGTGTKVANYYVKYRRELQPSKDPVYAQLVLILFQYVDVDGKKYTPALIGTGHEVKKRFKENGDEIIPDYVILPDDIEVGGDFCHILTLGDVKFTVYLHKNSAPDKTPDP